MDYFDLLFLVPIITYILLDTNAVVEYSKLFKLKFFHYQEYFAQNKSFPLNYQEFLLLKYDNFWTELFSCSICLSVWLNIIGYLIFWLNFRNIGFNIFFSWILYFWLKSFIKKSNE